MTPEQIVGLLPGAALDRLVHENIFGGQGKRKPYSSAVAAYEILKVLPNVCVGRSSPETPGHNPAKPYWAAIVEQLDDEGGARFTSILRIFAATPEVALCKVGLIAVNKQPVQV
jgi:hypothetical protein